MKRFFTKVFVCLSLATASLSLSSCSEDSINILGTILGELIGGLMNQGQTYNYSGEITSEAMKGSYSSKQWSHINSTGVNKLGNQVVALTNGTTGSITIPAYKDGNIQVDGIVISNLVSTTNGNVTSYDLGESSQISGTVTYGGKQYNCDNLYIEKAQATADEIILDITFYFVNDAQDDYDKAINFTYHGMSTGGK